VNTKGLRHAATFFGCCLFFVCIVLPIHGVTVELGLTGGGGLAFAYGSFLDSKTSALAELGAASFTTVGSSQAHLFPGWTAGVYGQIDLLSWLALRLEVVFESAGAERLALTSGGAPFDHYGLSFASVHIPVHALARTAIGPGQLYALLGPFLGIVAGSITVVDRYATATTTAVITPDISQVFFFGLSGGIGYAIGLGPGRAGIELRSDWSILPVSAGSGQSGGNLNPISLNIVVSYGFQLGKPIR
jgi:hypothetical protein